jgi:VanZ family protein
MKLKNTWLKFFSLSIGGLYIAFIFYICLTPTPPQTEIEIPFLDKIAHFLMYFGLIIWFGQIFCTKWMRWWFISFFSMGVLVENLQKLGGVRSFEYEDMISNAIGLTLGLFIVKSPLGELLSKFEDSITHD